jgi:hypothetical protein
MNTLGFGIGMIFKKEKTMYSLKKTLVKAGIQGLVVLLGAIGVAAASPEFLAAFKDLPLGGQIGVALGAAIATGVTNLIKQILK